MMATNYQSKKSAGGVLYIPPADAKRRVSTVPSSRAWKARDKYEVLSKSPSYTFTYQELLKRVAKPGNKTDSYSITRSELVKDWGWAVHEDASGRIALIGCETEEYKVLLTEPSVQKKNVCRRGRDIECSGLLTMLQEKAAYLLTWNPDKWNEWDLAQIAQKIVDGQTYQEDWRCGNKNIKPGDRVFLSKQGKDQPVGLIGSGIAISKPYQKPHYEEHRADKGERTQYVDVEFDYLVNGLQEVVVSRSELLERFPQQNWDTQQSGIKIKPEILLTLQQFWESRTKQGLDELFPPNDSLSLPESEEEEFPEGQELYKHHRTRERNRKLVKRAKEKRLEESHVLKCDVCCFNFSDVYGDLGAGYIECHHTKPVSELQPNERTNLKDIALVCANCHRMLHRKRPWLSIAELQCLIKPCGT